MTENHKDLQRLVRALYSDIADLPLLEKTSAAADAAEPLPNARVSLAAYEDSIRYCKDCGLHIGRSKLVFGRGSLEAQIVFVGDYPSDGDDASGKIFSDAAGELLHKMIVAMKVRPESVYLVNLFQCRPPKGASISESDLKTCDKHFRHQLDSVRPKHIVALGERAARALTRADSPLAQLRRQEFSYLGARLQCTYHPRDLLSDPALKKQAWEDLQAVMRVLGAS